MECSCVVSEKLQGFSGLCWVSPDTAVAISSTERCLYEVSVPPSMNSFKIQKVNAQFTSQLLCVQALIPGCGAAPSASSEMPGSQANQKSPFQLTRASGQAQDFGQTTIAVGCADGSVVFLYANVVPLGGNGQRVQVTRQKAFNLKEFCQTAEEVLPVTCMDLLQPRGSALVVGTETGLLCLFQLTGGQFQFKQVLKSDIQGAVHAVCGLQKNQFAYSVKNTVQIVSLARPNAPEATFRVPEGSSVTQLAYNGYTLVAGCEHSGLVFYDTREGTEISQHTAPPGDAVQSISCSPGTGEFICGTRRGALMVFRGNGLLREVCSTQEAVPLDQALGLVAGKEADGAQRQGGSGRQAETLGGQECGGVAALQCAPCGAMFLACCQTGFLCGIALAQRVSCGNYVVEPVDSRRLRFIDAVYQLNDIYVSPEPILQLLVTGISRVVIVAVTATSVIVWQPPALEEALGSQLGTVQRNQWIQEPQRSQSYTEHAAKSQQQAQQLQPQAAGTAVQAQTVGGVQFGVFNFERTEEQAARAAMQASEYSPVCKSALYLRHSVVGAWACERYLGLQDVSGEFHVCLLQGLSLVYTVYNGAVASPELLALNDSVCCLADGPVIRVTETGTGRYLFKSLVHQRRIVQVVLSQAVAEGQAGTAAGAGQPGAENANPAINIQLGNIFGGMVGAAPQQNAAGMAGAASSQAAAAAKQPGSILGLLDVSHSGFVHNLQNAAFYQKIGQTAQCFAPVQVASRILSLGFAPRSQLLTILALDSASFTQQNCTFLGPAENPDYQTRLRLLLLGHPVGYDAALPQPLFVSPVVVSLSGLIRAAAGVGFEEVVDNSAYQIAQTRLLARQLSSYKIERVSQATRPSKQADVVSAAKNCASCVVGLLGGSAHCVVSLPEFPFIIEQFRGNSQITQRLCRYVQQPALWAFLCGYAKEAGDYETLRFALAAVGQIPKALYEAGEPAMEVLMERGQMGRAVQRACDLWDFETARQLVSRDRRFGPLLVFLRRQLYRELGTTADEKVEPWAGLAKDFGDKATEAALDLVEK